MKVTKMTEQDLLQMRQLIREEVQPLRTEFTERLEAVCSEFKERLDAAVVSIGHDFSELRNEMVRRFETLERRPERIENNVNAIQFQTAGMSKSLTEGERLDSVMVVTQSAQQRAIDELAARVARIERELHFEDKQ